MLVRTYGSGVSHIRLYSFLVAYFFKPFVAGLSISLPSSIKREP